MTGLLKFILFAVLAFYFIGWISRILLRNWLQKKQKEFTQRYGESGGNYRQQNNTRNSGRREGEIKVEQAVRREKKASRNVGDYVEYEEIHTETEIDLENEN